MVRAPVEKTDSRTDDLGTCVNCPAPAVMKTDGVAANSLAFCDRDRPDNLR